MREAAGHGDAGIHIHHVEDAGLAQMVFVIDNSLIRTNWRRSQKIIDNPYIINKRGILQPVRDSTTDWHTLLNM